MINIQKWIDEKVDEDFTYHTAANGECYVTCKVSNYSRKFESYDKAMEHMEDSVKSIYFVLINTRVDDVLHIGNNEECQMIYKAFELNGQNEIEVWTIEEFLG